MKSESWIIKEARQYSTFDGWINSIFIGRNTNSNYYDNSIGEIVRKYTFESKLLGFKGWHDLYKKAWTFKDKTK